MRDWRYHDSTTASAFIQGQPSNAYAKIAWHEGTVRVRSRSNVRFAVIGAGVIGDVHAQAIGKLADVATLSLVVSTREATARRLAEARRAGGYSTELDTVLADPDIDAVSICTPTGSHAELAMAALHAGGTSIVGLAGRAPSTGRQRLPMVTSGQSP